MSGAPDPLYVEARRVLLDAAEALAAHLDSIVLVGAQAIYLYTGDADLAVAEFTTDADLGVDPTNLAAEPLIDRLLRRGGFLPRDQPGGWVSASGVYLDLMVPEALAGSGRRSADLGAHGKRVARRTVGLEGAWIDCAPSVITSLDPADPRQVTMNVAGPGALLIAKLHKLGEQVANDDRIKDKDALDIFRLLRAVPTDELSRRLRRLLESESAGPVTIAGLRLLQHLFGTVDDDGIRLAQRASQHLIDPDELGQSAASLTHELLNFLKSATGRPTFDESS